MVAVYIRSAHPLPFGLFPPKRRCELGSHHISHLQLACSGRSQPCSLIYWDFHCKLMLIRELKSWRSIYDISGILAESATDAVLVVWHAFSTAAPSNALFSFAATHTAAFTVAKLFSRRSKTVYMDDDFQNWRYTIDYKDVGPVRLNLSAVLFQRSNSVFLSQQISITSASAKFQRAGPWPFNL